MAVDLKMSEQELPSWTLQPPDPRRAPAPPGELFRRSRRVFALVTGATAELSPEREREILQEIQLLGVSVLPQLRALAAEAAPQLALLIQRAVSLLLPDEIGHQLADGLTKEERRYPAEVGACLLARLCNADLDIAQVLLDVDALTEEARRYIGEALGKDWALTCNQEHSLQVLHRLGEFWRERGFRGSKLDYYDVANSWLPDVLRRRSGIPISLSILFLALCRRLGLAADGVGMPTHFIVRVPVSAQDQEGFIFLDPFHGARPLELEDCRRLVESAGVRFVPEEHLKAASAREILVRMCNNLLAIFDQQKEMRESERVATVLIHLSPSNPVPFLIRAERRMRRGKELQAREDLQRVLQLEQKGPLAYAAGQLLQRLDLGHF